MTDLRKAAQMALLALESRAGFDSVSDAEEQAIKALYVALAHQDTMTPSQRAKWHEDKMDLSKNVVGASRMLKP